MQNSSLKRIAIALCAVIIASGLGFIWASSPSWSNAEKYSMLTHQYPTRITDDNVYSLVSYNIGYLSGLTNNRAVVRDPDFQQANMQSVKQRLDELGADILAIQEIDYQADRSFNVNQQNEIAKLGYNHVAQAVNWDVNYVPFPYGMPSVHFGRVVSGQSVLSKYPMIKHRPVILDRVPETPYYRDAFYLDRLAQVVHIVLDQQVVVVINVHLESYDRTTRGRQLQQVIALYKRYSKRFPTLLVGDFNSDPVSPNAHIHELLAIPNIGAAAFSIDNYGNTYNSGTADQRLDYIFYNRVFIAPIDGRIATEFGQLSDHFPVLFRFKLRPLAVHLPTDDAPRL